MEPGLLRQVMLTLLVSTVTLSSGICAGWLSPMTSKLRFESPVGRMTTHEISYLANIPHYTGVFLAFFYGFVANKFGRKDALVSVGVPSVASGLILTFTRSKILLYVGRGLAGCTTVGGVMASAMYVSETVDSSIRGTCMAVLALQFYLGILVSEVLGDVLSYHDYNLIGVAVPLMYSVLILWLPESPHYLITQRRVKYALQSLMWLRDGDLIAAKKDLDSMRADRRPEENPNIIKILKSTSSKTALLVSLLACVLQVISGIYAIPIYSKTIFNETISSVGSVKPSTVLTMLISVTTLLSVFLIDTIGRKTLLYVSFTGSCVSLATLSCFLFTTSGQTSQTVEWLPIICVTVFVVSYAAGLTTVPGVLTNELPSPNVKPTISAVVAAVTQLVLIAVLWSSSYWEVVVGLHTVFTVSTVFNLLGVFFTWRLVPETAGKSLVEITRELGGERVLLIDADVRV